ncbi:MAG: thermonuclease family protein [Clostridia bacterium]|nr:thermonuclease family protein [Clostridia bacterium]
MKRSFALLAVLCLLIGCIAGCGKDNSDPKTDGGEESKFVDYVEQTKLDLNSNTKKLEVSVHAYIDGDTTHFTVPRDVAESGILKARYMGINTPESTGKIEEWGKKASTFTKEKLSTAASIMVESNDDKWNLDSSGGRHLVYVWYKPTADADYRCLNLEIIQNGLSISCGTVNDRYGQAATDAFQQAKREKLHVFSGQKDPGFYYGDAYEVDLKGLRTNIALYDNAKVAFEGVVTRNNNNSVYVEEYDAETAMYYGMSVYYGFETGALLNNLAIGNRVRVVGTVTYYETGGTWQVSGLSFREFKPDDPGNTKVISTGHQAGNVETDPAMFADGTMEVEVLTSLDSDETEMKTFNYAELIMSTTISMKNLKVLDAYTTQNGGNNDGAMTLTCRAEDGTMIDVRTIVLRDEAGNLKVEADYLNKTIDVIGIVDSFSGAYQIKVLTDKDIVVH